MKRIIIIAIILTCAIILPRAILAAEYYVNEGGSIQAAVDQAVPGDTVMIRGGRYYEKVILVRSGTDSNPITFQGYEDETVIMDGTELISGWTQCQSNDALLTIGGVVNANYASIYKVRLASTVFPTNKYATLLLENFTHCRIAI